MKRKNLPVVPASLLVAGKSCLVVGGGPVALGKIQHLIQGQAKVAVIAPEVDETVGALEQSGSITLSRREYNQEILDKESYALVYAATSSVKVNKVIIGDCRRKGILCCAVDKNWPDGNFVTPAILRGRTATVAVSTGGASCRRSRIVKEQLSRQLTTLEGSQLLVLGTSHRELSLSNRECFHLAGERLKEFGDFLMQLRGIHEFMILNTCNRVELIAVANRDDKLLSLIKQWLSYDRLKENEYFCYWGWEAFSHLNTLTAGLLSQTPGENHIVAQVKEAHSTAGSFGWSRLILKQWVDTTLHISRHIRQVSSPHLRQVELEDLCLEYLERKGCTVDKVIIVGTGMIGKELVERFYKQKTEILWFYHQNRPSLSDEESTLITLFPLKDLENHLKNAEALLCATGSDTYVLKKEMGSRFPSDRNSWLIDLSMPRNIDPDLDRGSINVIDLDDLKHWYRREAADWDIINRESSTQIEEHREEYEKIINSFAHRSS